MFNGLKVFHRLLTMSKYVERPGVNNVEIVDESCILRYFGLWIMLWILWIKICTILSIFRFDAHIKRQIN